ncbi:hypothetical protein DB346_14330 [Verrucomicrobia bacterium LW23]|nr:hypothetical protein DB346_14330 [Verrucomicrobia bacterium LW23]
MKSVSFCHRAGYIRAFATRALAAVLFAAFAAAPAITPARAVDFCNGQVTAVPVRDGKAPAVDGNLGDWDLSAQEPVYISEQSAHKMNGDWAFMYDDEAFYIAARVTMPGRPYTNINNPQDAFWSGDILQVRMSADPGAKYPLDRDRDAANTRIVHLSFWRNTQTQENFLHVAEGTKLNLGKSVNPPGSKVILLPDGEAGYTLEARVPWSAMNVPGGRNPFKPGDKTALIAETIYIGGDTSRVPLCYNTNPGTFAFNRPNAWGRVEFAAKSLGERRRPTLQALIAAMGPAETGLPTVGVPIEVTVPEGGRKVSLNIMGPKGEVLREVIGGESLTGGRHTIHWDGRDAWGRQLEPGTYTWGAYMHGGLRAEYAGSVGTSGIPPWSTRDGKGGWGGDHSNPIAAAADASGIYLLWPVSEAGRAIVKVDYEGKVLWRNNPFVGGGFGPFYGIASDGEYLYLTRGNRDAYLVRLKADTGALMTWGADGPSEMLVSRTDTPAVVPCLTTPASFSAGKDYPPTSFTRSRSDGIAPKLYVGIEEDEASDLPPVLQPDPVGLAYSPRDGGTLYLSVYSADKVLVLDAATGKAREGGANAAELKVRGPRGLAVAPGSGDLYAVSYVPGREGVAEVLCFAGGQGEGKAVISGKAVLDAPFGIALDVPAPLKGGHSSGSAPRPQHIFVSNLGAAQQVKVFDAQSGREVGAIGTKGGRPWQGRYNGAALLMPAGLAMDAKGCLVVPEAAPPKVFSRFSLQMNEGGSEQPRFTEKLEKRWFGPGVYWNSTWPMPEDPRHVFYMNSHAIGRARLGSGPDQPGLPDAYWESRMAGFPQIPDMEGGIPQPQTLRAANGRLYLVRDAREHAVMVLNDDETMRPVATFTAFSATAKDNPLKINHLKVWVDQNGDGRVQESEESVLKDLADGQPFPVVSHTTASVYMEPKGDLLFSTSSNCILHIPAAEKDAFAADGSVRWNMAGARLLVREVLPGAKQMHTTYRQGILGVRRDSAGHIYTAFNTRVDGTSGGPFDYPTPAIATRMKEGMGHTSSFNVIKFARYDAAGNLVWMAGRKATAGARPGEMYHHWNLAGLVNDRYVAAGSEWGQIYFYTTDGFFVDALMNNPGDVTQPGPYTFGGETSGGRVAFFAETGELWAYSTGMAYQVRGFSQGVVERETRLTGEVRLDKFYDLPEGHPMAGAAPVKPLQVVELKENAARDNAMWRGIPTAELKRNGKPLARAQLALDQEFLYARIQVADESPLQNGAGEVQLAFKGGDTAGIVLGPVRNEAKAKDKAPVAGDIRLMAAMIGGKPRLIAMKAVPGTASSPAATPSAAKPFEYYTPSAGRVQFVFVDEVPGARVELTRSAPGDDAAGGGTSVVGPGYTATFAVPRAFLDRELELKSGTTVRGDIEVRLSGDGGRGLQATSRNYYFTPNTAETTMTDDVPTEARLYPQHWGPVEIVPAGTPAGIGKEK